MISNLSLDLIAQNICKIENLKFKQRIYNFVYSCYDKQNYILKIFNENRKNPHFKNERLFTKLNSIKNIIENCKDVIVPIKSYGYISYRNGNYIYYIMKKLNKVSFTTGDLMESSMYNPVPNIKKLDSKQKEFIKKISKINIKYLDFHGGNIVKDNAGNYKLIDLEGFVYPSDNLE